VYYWTIGYRSEAIDWSMTGPKRVLAFNITLLLLTFSENHPHDRNEGCHMINDAQLYRELGKRLKEFREYPRQGRQKLTQADLATAIGLERTSISNIEKGVQKLPLHVLYRICEVLGADVDAVLPTVSDLQTVNAELIRQDVVINGKAHEATPLVAKALGDLSLTDS
jgi:Predicted transcriptional regulators